VWSPILVVSYNFRISMSMTAIPRNNTVVSNPAHHYSTRLHQQLTNHSAVQRHPPPRRPPTGGQSSHYSHQRQEEKHHIIDDGHLRTGEPRRLLLTVFRSRTRCLRQSAADTWPSQSDKRGNLKSVKVNSTLPFLFTSLTYSHSRRHTEQIGFICMLIT